jgi:hypothetical protein
MNDTKFFSRSFTRFKDLERFVNYNKIEQNQIVSVTETKTITSIHFYAKTLLCDTFAHFSDYEKEKLFNKLIWIMEPDESPNYLNLLNRFELNTIKKPTFFIVLDKVDFSTILPLINNTDLEEDFLSKICELNPDESTFKELNKKVFSVDYNWKILRIN